MDDYTIELDNALSLIADRINLLTEKIETTRFDIPMEAYLVNYYVHTVGLSIRDALTVVGIPTDNLELAVQNKEPQGVETSEVIEGYQVSMRSLQSSIEALKSIFDAVKDNDDTEVSTCNVTEKELTENEETKVSDTEASGKEPDTQEETA